MGFIKGVVRVGTLICVAMTPVLASSTRGARTALPRSVRIAGRDEGLYRRLKLMKARQMVLEHSRARNLAQS